MRDAGRFIVLEGGEGAGKSTQTALLSSWLENLGIPHLTAREPGGTGVGEAIREVVLKRRDLHVGAESELFLILAARAAFVREVVAPALEEGKTVVADRFDLSTLAYQGYGRGLPLEKVRVANELATGGLVPDVYVVLDVPVEQGAKRQERQGKEPDRMEASGPDFHERVRQGYLALSRSEPRVRVVSGVGSPEEVHQRIREILTAEFPELADDRDRERGR
ncbi:MAG: dTMP kinase [Gemmatimonadota bacterium]